MRRLTFISVIFSFVIVACGGNDDNTTNITDEQRAEWSKISSTQINTNRFVFDALTAGPESGTPVILLHGFPTTSDQYRDILAALGSEGYYAIAPDQRGYSPGARPETQLEYRLEYLAQDIMDIADSLSLDTFHLVGHDYGALVVWAVGALHPDRLLSITPISTPHPQAFIQAFFNPESDQSDRSSYGLLFAIEGYETEMLANDNEILLSYYGDADLELIDLFLDKMANEDALGAALNWYQEADWEWNLALPAITVPTLYIWSDNDLYLGRHAAEATGNFVQGEYTFETIEGASHSVPETRPEEITALLINHFGGS
ncbi:MAG: alpha/beta hydrolase [Agarilytica sp.]